ncbi:MAG: RagB/SusD family nutrient uptake outer membrane protein [Bacteroidota bacterium]
MKKITIWGMLLMIVMLTGACQKYLDVKKNSIDKFIETAEDCQRILDNHDVMNIRYPSDGEASADNYFIGENIYPGLELESKQIYTWQSGAISTGSGQWLYAYQIIYYANVVLESLEKIKSETDPVQYNHIKGSALFFRAYSLWNIAQVHCQPYDANATTNLGVPARTTADLNDTYDRGTVKDTYDRIISDLSQAVDLVPINTTPTRPNKTSCEAMLARVYLSMENYDLALKFADESIQRNGTLLDYNQLSDTDGSPFVQFNDEVLFHSLMIDNPLLVSGDAFNPGARINADLVNTYDDNDLRKTLFFNANLTSGPDPGNPDNTIDVPDGTYRFDGNYSPNSDGTLFNGLTTAEIYLTRAECRARLGNLPGALNDLNFLLVKRWKEGTYVNYTSSNADDVLRKILDERRKELVMRGLRWTDLRRLNKDSRFRITLSRSDGNATYTLPPGDLRYVLLIGQNVINRSGMQQNPR